MARRRMIDPNFWTSEDISKLNIQQRLLVIGLFSNADDEGKGKANPAAIRSAVFTYDDISLQEITWDIEVIQTVINIIFYEIDGSKYYKFINWTKWQRVDKPQKSLIPDQNSNDSENRSKNDSENDSVESEEPFSPKGKEKKGTKEYIVASDECDIRFEEFWKAYPKRDGKAVALKKWQTFWKNKQINFEEIMEGLRRYKIFVNHERTTRKFDRAWLSGSTFVNQRQWESEWAIESNVRQFVKPTDEYVPTRAEYDEAERLKQEARMKRAAEI
jgi:hypothetical protein